MKLIKPSIEILPDINPENLFQQLELYGRVCYKSESKITETSSIKFIQDIIKKGHESILEHANIILEVSDTLYESISEFNSKFLKFLTLSSMNKNLISGNIRAWRNFIRERDFFPEIRSINYFLYRNFPILFSIPNEDDPFDSTIKLINQNDLPGIDHKSQSVRIICDRGVSHELVRHRLCSFSQESTRYCKYQGNYNLILPNDWNFDAEDQAVAEYLEHYYDRCIQKGRTPQQARYWLPSGYKTELIMTAPLSEWYHIMQLRTSKAAHPQMREIMFLLLPEMKKKYPGIFDD